MVGKPIDRPACEGDVGEPLDGVRPNQKLAKIPCPAMALPVLGVYDVVVIGGGTGGAPAGIAAARQGAKTLVVEYLHGLGGVGTLGAISGYCAGNRVGFTATVQADSKDPNPGSSSKRSSGGARRCSGRGPTSGTAAIGCGALVDRGRVVGAIVATPKAAASSWPRPSWTPPAMPTSRPPPGAVHLHRRRASWPCKAPGCRRAARRHLRQHRLHRDR